MGVDHLGEGMSVQALMREVKRVAKATLQNASIGRAGIRVYDGGWIRIEGGGLAVTGTQTVSGRLEGSGVLDWTGNVYFRGPTGVQGNFAVSGPANISGTLTVAGATSLTNTLTVSGSGKIVVGNMVIDPSGGGSVEFPGGAMVQADPSGGIRMVQGTSRVFVGSGLVSMQMGSRSVAISASGIQMNGLDTIPSSLANGAPAGCIWSDGSGEIFRVVPD